MKKNKLLAVLSTTAIAAIMSIATVGTAFAQNGDIYDLTTKQKVSNATDNLRTRMNFALKNAAKSNMFGYELDGQVYNLADINKSVGKLEARTQDNVTKTIKSLKSQGKAEDFKQKLDVKSVSAITTTVDVNGTLDFEMQTNQGVKTVEDLKEITDAGYVVKFLASANKLAPAGEGNAVNTNTTGIVKAIAGEKFDYQVVVEKDGEKVAESERVTVEVKEFAKTVTEISAIELYVTQGTNTDVKVTSGKLVNAGTTKDTAKVKVIGRTANMKADGDITENEGLTLSTDKVAIISAIAKNTGEITFGRALGNVTITAKAGDITKAITVDVVDEARKVSAENSTIAVDAVEIAAGKTSDKIRVELKDQYGDAFVGTVTATNDENVTVLSNATATQAEDKDGKDIVGAYDLVLTAGAKAAKGNVVVKAGENNSEVELGKIYVTVKEAGDVADYKLETADRKYEIELMGNADPTLTLTLNGYDAEGLLVGPETLTDYSFASSNEKVATVNNDETNKGKVTAVAPGTAVIKVYKTEDAFKTTIAEVTVTVKNSTPAITDAKVVAPEKMTEAGKIVLKDIFTEVTALDPEGKAVKVNPFGDAKVTVGESNVEIGSFLVTPVKAEGSTVKAENISEGKIKVSGEGKATINIALLNAKGEIVKDVNVEVDIPVTPAEDGTDGQDVNGEVDIPAAPAEDGTDGQDVNGEVDIPVTPADSGTEG